MGSRAGLQAPPVARTRLSVCLPSIATVTVLTGFFATPALVFCEI
jgi:hypothetical protein